MDERSEEDQAELAFIALVDAMCEEDYVEKATAAAVRLAGLGWAVGYIFSRAPTLRERNDAVFWFTTLDTVISHGKWTEAAKVYRKLSQLGWVVSRLPRPGDPAEKTVTLTPDEVVAVRKVMALLPDVMVEDEEAVFGHIADAEERQDCFDKLIELGIIVVG